MTADLALINAIRNDIADGGDPERAAGQQHYMKSALRYAGVTTPELRAILHPHLRGWHPPDRRTWADTICLLWDDVTHREEWYAAIALARHPAARSWRDPESMVLWRHLVVTGAWWDVVDDIATHLVGEVLSSYRDTVTPTVRSWSRAEDLWVRRTAVLAQLLHRDRTDPDLLADVVQANVDDDSFWLRKAVGWALRQYSATDAAWVRVFVDEHPTLSPLSRREALKRIG